MQAGGVDLLFQRSPRSSAGEHVGNCGLADARRLSHTRVADAGGIQPRSEVGAEPRSALRGSGGLPCRRLCDQGSWVIPSHDLRRSTVRNLVAAGVDQTVAMRITRHQTISVFQRYRIVADEDVRAALDRTQTALANLVASQTAPPITTWKGRGTIRGTTGSAWYTRRGETADS